MGIIANKIEIRTERLIDSGRYCPGEYESKSVIENFHVLIVSVCRGEMLAFSVLMLHSCVPGCTHGVSYINFPKGYDRNMPFQLNIKRTQLESGLHGSP